MIDAEILGKALCPDHMILFDAATDARGTSGQVARRVAKEICLSCPIRSECIEDTLEFREINTFRAGLSSTQWQRYFKKRNIR